MMAFELAMARPNRFLISSLLALYLFLAASGCGGGARNVSDILQPATGNVTLLGSDSPACDVVSFTVTITGASLTPDRGGSPVAVISSSSPITVDFAALVDFTTVLRPLKVLTGTYSSITLTFADPHITVLDTARIPPQPVEIPATMTPLTVTADLNPTLAVGPSSSNALVIDFNLLKSLQTDSNGQLTGTVIPVLQVSAASASVGSGFGNLEELKGIVQAVTRTHVNPAFTGSFTIPRTPTSTELLTVNTTDLTRFDGAAGISDLVPGKSFVEVDAYLDTSDNIVAKQVEAEGAVSATKGQGAFIGLITSLDRDSSGNATQFDMWVREEAPDLTALVPQGSLLLVKVDGTTQFAITPDGVNQANLPFSAALLGPGQSVIVHGQAQSGFPPSLTASSIFLRLQSIVGTLVPLPPPVVGGDGKTGGFNLASCSSLYGSAPLTVFTFGSTDFSGITGGGLTGLSEGPSFVVKGVALFEQSPVFVNGMGLNPPTTAVEAKDVRELP